MSANAARYLPVGVAGAALLLAGAFQYARSAKQADPAAAAAAQAKLDSLPLSVAGWAGTPREFDEKILRHARAVAYSSRSYVRGADRVEMLVIAGDPGDIGAHDPERCYGGIGYASVGDRQKAAVPGDGYWAETFRAETYPPTVLRVFWAWSDGGPWRAADDARLEYAGRNVLYKLYVTRRLNPAATGGGPAGEFLAAFLPAARGCLGRPPGD